MAHVVMGRLFPAHIVRSRYIAPQSLPTGCGGNARPRPYFRLLLPRPHNRATVRSRTFSAVRKSVAFPYYLPTSAFSGFAPGRLA